MKAEIVKEEMNRCGKAGKAFLFGVDFELKEGFFAEDPLKNNEIAFTCGTITNTRQDSSPIPVPQLNIYATNAGAYHKKFAVVRKGLLHGNSFLLNLTEKTPIHTNLSLEQIFHNSSARYKLLLPGRLVCFSPESFVRIINGEIFSYPMKGTIDATLPDAAKLLIGNHKETCEHHTIVDLIRNDLNRVATGVEVKRFRYVEEIHTLHGHILQTSSEITGRLPAGWQQHLGSLLFELLPAGSVSGAPKPATVQLIRQAEGEPRGYYTGVFGYFDGRDLDSGVMIRYIEKKGKHYFFRSGGGITINSLPGDEYREVLEKIYLPINPYPHAKPTIY